jgi:hypothetical protein
LRLLFINLPSGWNWNTHTELLERHLIGNPVANALRQREILSTVCI